MNLNIKLLLLSFTLSAAAMAQQLNGFEYGHATAPDGSEWQSPQRLGYNKLQPHAYFTSFGSVRRALHVLPDSSDYCMSLDGQWKFYFAKNPDERPKTFYEPTFDVSSWDDIMVPCSWNMAGIGKDGSQKYGRPIYVNQPVIFYHQVKVGDWKDGVMRQPPTHWTTYEFRNEVGSYRRTFTLPKEWMKKRQVIIRFDGVDSFFYLWINGHYVGFSKNSRNTAEFDITPFLNKKGENVVAAEVYRSSDGSFLEAQDMFRLPGIFRSVSIVSRPETHIADIVVRPAPMNTFDVMVTVEKPNDAPSKVKMEFALFKNKLYSDECELEHGITGTVLSVEKDSVNSRRTVFHGRITAVSDLEPWSAERPQVYTLGVILKDGKNKFLECTAVQTGMRTVEIKETTADDDEFHLAGRYFYVNGKPLKLKGVNRCESNPLQGHHIPHAQMEREVMLMKAANINHVRTSHYANDPYFYYLCNKYGIYLEAEANIESHEYYYGAASLSHVPEWRAAHVSRVMELAHARVNDPCIVIWSLGNEAGPGINFKAAYSAVKAFDSRPVQYERNNGIVDMGSNQYPSVGWVQQAVKGQMNIKYPFHISEYAHSMGNAVGNLADYWKAIESTNFFCGGAIWDWVDQSLYNYTADGKRYLAYGGDFGDMPNDGQFVMNGIMFGDLTPKPQYYEVKKVYQYVDITEEDFAAGTVRIFNKNYYSDDLSGYDLRWQVLRNGVTACQGTAPLGRVAPRKHTVVTLPEVAQVMQKIKAEGSADEYFLRIQLCQKHDMPWCKAGYVQAEEQMALRFDSKQTQSSSEHPLPQPAWPVFMQEGDKLSTIKTADNLSAFDKLSPADTATLRISCDEATGTIDILRGHQVVARGLQLSVYRDPVDNDNWGVDQWFQSGLHSLKHQIVARQTFIDESGRQQLKLTIESQGTPERYIGWNRNFVEIKPIDNPQISGVKFTTDLIITQQPSGVIEVRAAVASDNPRLVLPRLGFQLCLPRDLHNLCYYGRGPVGNYPDRQTSQFVGIYKNKVEQEFRPFPRPQDMANHGDTRWVQLTDDNGRGLQFLGAQPMSISALPWSAQQLTLARHPHELPESDGIYLHLDKAITGLGGNSCGQGGPLVQDRVKAGPQQFSFAIRPVLTAGEVQGTIPYVFSGEEPALREKARLAGIPLSVKFVSSEETQAEDARADYLVDGDDDTFWHTTYGVTVANYPHWVEFDCGAVKPIRGFAYLPRQDSPNGNIKAYRVQVSQDGEHWSQPTAEGTFANDRQLKKVIFAKPVKARYVRFTALSSQDGQDFASGAEFTILEK